MSEIDLGSQTITVLAHSESTQVDALNIPATVGTPTDQPGCSFQPKYTSERDTNKDFSKSIWVVFAPPTSLMLALKASDSIEHLGVEYQVFGDPMPWVDEDDVINHVRFEVRKARG